MRKAPKCKGSFYVLHESFGPLYIVAECINGSGKVFIAVNGKDGVSYNFNECEVTKAISRDEFDAILAERSSK